jgi:hypothetical protein
VKQHPAAGVFTSTRPFSGETLVTSPVIVWRPVMTSSVADVVVDGGGVTGPCAIARPASSTPAVAPASTAGSFMTLFSFDNRLVHELSNARATAAHRSK